MDIREQLQSRVKPISRSSVSVNVMGELTERESLLSQRIVEGYGCIWGSKNGHDEIFVRGAFAKSIAEHGPSSNASYQIKFRDEHGRACALFAELREDNIGLYFKTKPLDNVQWCDDLLEQLRTGTINNFSNGFKFILDKVKYDEANDAFIVSEARLFEISAVAIPSDIQTYAMRSAETQENINKKIEKFLSSLENEKELEGRKLFADTMSIRKMDDMEGEANENKNIEFINKMIPHHEMALDMVKEYKSTVTDSRLKEIMANITEAQTAEIKELKAIKKELNTRNNSLTTSKPNASTLRSKEPIEPGLDYQYLLNNLKLF